MALATGCSDIVSNEADSWRTSLGEGLKETTSVTSSFPLVRVPVLSKTNVLTLPRLSRYFPPFTSTPLLAADVMAEAMDTGVDMVSAHGHETTSKIKAL